MSSAKRRVLRALIACRTAALGGHLERCDQCGYERPVYNSCGNRHCPKCQAAARAEWLEAQAADLLPVEYFHVIFTAAPAIAVIALQNKKTMYDILLRASAHTLQQIAADPRHLGAEIGFLSILHTWGQNLMHHPHVHCVVPGGGLSPDGTRWIACRPGFFLPYRILREVFRGKVLDMTRRAFAQGDLSFHGKLAHLNDPDSFAAHLRTAYASNWVIHLKPPFGGPEQVLKYLARYTHRVAISNQRLVSLNNGKVQFRWKDYAHGNRKRVMTLDATEFIRRFLLHVLPKGFVRIRHYGFLANACRQNQLSRCRELLGCVGDNADASHEDNVTGDLFVEGSDTPVLCPVCKKGHLTCVTLPAETAHYLRPKPPALIDSS